MSVRGMTSYPQQGFGKGLNLSAKPDAVDPAECIDALNVDFTDQGAIQQRDGYGKLTSSELTNRVDSLEVFYTSTGTRQLLAGCGTRLEAINTSGGIVASKASLEGGPWDFCRFGTPNSETAYAGNGKNTLLKWSGTEWTAPTATVDGSASKAMPKAKFLCVQTPDNRLVAAGYGTTTGGPNGTTSSASTVYFSEAGNPEAWKTAGTAENPNNSVQLTPGDGEPITGAIAWKEYVFVFKETKFFVFDGNSIDGEGNPIFNYRTVDTGVGCVSPRSICADANGVYFMSRTGMHRTTGQEPRLLSALIEPVWSGDISAFYTGGTIAHGFITNCAATLHQERLYLSFPTEEAANRVLVYDPEIQWWSLFDFPAATLASFRIGLQAELVFGYSSGTMHVGRHSSAFTTDDGAVIASRWRSGWFDLGNPDVKTIRSSKIWGTEEVGMALGHDFRENPGASNILNFVDTAAPMWGGTTWGGSRWAEPKGLLGAERRVAARGTTFSVSFTGVGLPFSVHRIDHHLREIRKPSTVKRMTLPTTINLPTPENNSGTNDWSDVYSNDKTLKEAVQETNAAVNASLHPITWYAPKEIAAEQSTSSTSFTTLSTSDEIPGVVVPAGGLLRVGYVAVWSSSVASAGRVVLQANGTNIRTPRPTEGNAETGTLGTSYHLLTTAAFGTHGEVNVLETGNELLSVPVALSIGMADITGLVAGTYTIAVKYRATSGSVTARERKLWAEVHGT